MDPPTPAAAARPERPPSIRRSAPGHPADGEPPQLVLPAAHDPPAAQVAVLVNPPAPIAEQNDHPVDLAVPNTPPAIGVAEDATPTNNAVPDTEPVNNVMGTSPAGNSDSADVGTENS